MSGFALPDPNVEVKPEAAEYNCIVGHARRVTTKTGITRIVRYVR